MAKPEVAAPGLAFPATAGPFAVLQWAFRTDLFRPRVT